VTLDAVIVGSGPGGSAAAQVLTEAGWTVAIVEKGRNHLLDPDDLTRPSSDYSNDEIKFHSRHFLGPVPSTVGGGGTHADGKVPRFLPADFRLLSDLGPQPDADVADWPVTYDELEPFYAEVERSIGVAGTAGANPFAGPRSGPYPMPSGAPMFGATVSSAAAERLGYHPYPAPTAANSVPYDGRPACNNCGFCAFFGCPIHAKGDPVAMLMRAMATGRAELLSETFVSRVRFEGRRATGVDLIGPDGVERFVGARYVVVAAGAIETPRLLLLSGVEHPLVGRYLMTHFQTIAAGSMPFRTYAERGRAVTHLHDDMIVGDEASRAAATTT
jgi:choline dehydrogenase-like flavoprotein